ncbi:MAG: hypothetical protein MHPSP_000120, partial [Paramarteilia canceri]
ETATSQLFLFAELFQFEESDLNIFQRNKLIWLQLLSLLRSRLHDWHLSKSTAIPSKIDQYINIDNIAKELDEGLFNPKDYFVFVSNIMSELCAEARDGEINRLKDMVSKLQDHQMLFNSNKIDLDREAVGNYLLNLKQCTEQVFRCCSLLISDIQTYHQTVKVELIKHLSKDQKELQKFVVDFEKDLFHQIYSRNQIALHLKKNELSIENILGSTKTWIVNSDYNMAKAYTNLIMIATDKVVVLPETLKSVDIELSYLANFFKNFVAVLCITTFLKGKFNSLNLKFDEKAQNEIMVSIRRVMSASPENSVLFELENVCNNYKKFYEKYVPISESLSLLAEMSLASKPKNHLYQLIEKRMYEFLENCFDNLITSGPQERDQIVNRLPSQFRIIEKMVVDLTFEAMSMVYINWQIYSSYYVMILKRKDGFSD